MYERPAMDVSNAETQAAIADSLLDDSNLIATIPHNGQEAFMQEGSEFADSDARSSQFSNGNALTDEYINDTDPEGVGLQARLKYGDAVVDKRIKERGESVPEREDKIFSDDEMKSLSKDERLQRRIEAEEKAGQEQETKTEPAAELTQEQFQSIVGQTHQAVKDLGMVEAPKLAADLAPFFEAPTAQHAEEIGLTLGGLTLGASQLLTQLYKDGKLGASAPMDFDQLTPLPAVACNYLAEKWCAFRGQQEPAKDPATLGNALRNGIANLIHSKGKTDPQMAVLWVQAMEEASTGRKVQPSEKDAMDFVNALTPHIRAAVGKFNAATAQAKPKSIPRMTTAKKYNGIRTPSLRREVRQIGNGLDADTLKVYQREHGRL